MIGRRFDLATGVHFGPSIPGVTTGPDQQASALPPQEGAPKLPGTRRAQGAAPKPSNG